MLRPFLLTATRSPLLHTRQPLRSSLSNLSLSIITNTTTTTTRRTDFNARLLSSSRDPTLANSEDSDSVAGSRYLPEKGSVLWDVINSKDAGGGVVVEDFGDLESLDIAASSSRSSTSASASAAGSQGRSKSILEMTSESFSSSSSTKTNKKRQQSNAKKNTPISLSTSTSPTTTPLIIQSSILSPSSTPSAPAPTTKPIQHTTTILPIHQNIKSLKTTDLINHFALDSLNNPYPKQSRSTLLLQKIRNMSDLEIDALSKSLPLLSLLSPLDLKLARFLRKVHPQIKKNLHSLENPSYEFLSGGGACKLKLGKGFHNKSIGNEAFEASVRKVFEEVPWSNNLVDGFIKGGMGGGVLDGEDFRYDFEALESETERIVQKAYSSRRKNPTKDEVATFRADERLKYTSERKEVRVQKIHDMVTMVLPVSVPQFLKDDVTHAYSVNKSLGNQRQILGTLYHKLVGDLTFDKLRKPPRTTVVVENAKELEEERQRLKKLSMTVLPVSYFDEALLAKIDELIEHLAVNLPTLKHRQIFTYLEHSGSNPYSFSSRLSPRLTARLPMLLKEFSQVTFPALNSFFELDLHHEYNFEKMERRILEKSDTNNDVKLKQAHLLAQVIILLKLLPPKPLTKNQIKLNSIQRSIEQVELLGLPVNKTFDVRKGRPPKEVVCRMEAVVLSECNFGEGFQGEIHNKIFIDNLPIDITEEELEFGFSQLGQVRRVEVFNLRRELDPDYRVDDGGNIVLVDKDNRKKGSKKRLTDKQRKSDGDSGGGDAEGEGEGEGEEELASTGSGNDDGDGDDNDNDVGSSSSDSDSDDENDNDNEDFDSENNYESSDKGSDEGSDFTPPAPTQPAHRKGKKAAGSKNAKKSFWTKTNPNRSKNKANHTPIYAFVEFADNQGKVNVFQDASLSVFGMVFRKHNSLLSGVDGLGCLYIEDIPKTLCSLDLEFHLNKLLGPEIYVCLSLAEHEFANPSALYLNFSSHELALYARKKIIEGGKNGDLKDIKINWVKTQSDAMEYYERTYSF